MGGGLFYYLIAKKFSMFSGKQEHQCRVLEFNFDLDGTPEVSSWNCDGGDQPGSDQLPQSRHVQHQVGLVGRQKFKTEASPISAVIRITSLVVTLLGQGKSEMSKMLFYILIKK